MRRELSILGLAAILSACATVRDAHPVALNSDEADRVNRAFALWPAVRNDGTPLKRPFFATIRLGGRNGHRVTASGVMEFDGPRDFRMTAVSELGTLLFDARINWAGVTMLRKMAEMDERQIQAIMEDVSLALQKPEDLGGLEAGADQMVLTKKPGDTHEYEWLFDARTGRPERLEVDRGPFDQLRVSFHRYTPLGWPEELMLQRSARGYEATITFTDNHVVQGNWRGNSER